MEAFESFVAIALEAEGFVVSEAVKFPVKRQTRKTAYDERQTHGFEVDLVGARADRLVLATVKSFFGSRGVVSEHVMGTTSSNHKKLHALLNDPTVRRAVVRGAAKRYGYRANQVQVRLYAGRFAAPTLGTHEPNEFAVDKLEGVWLACRSGLHGRVGPRPTVAGLNASHATFFGFETGRAPRGAPVRCAVAASQFFPGWREILGEFNAEWPSNARALTESLAGRYQTDARSNLEFRRFCELRIQPDLVAGPILDVSI